MNEKQEKLNALLDTFLEDQSRENKINMVNALLGTTVFLPGVFPPGTDLSALPKPPNPGERLQLPKGMNPLPAIMKNKNGETFFPAYVAQELIPAEPKPQVVINMPFMALVTMAINNPIVNGIAVNPFKQNVLLREPLLKALKEDEAKRKAAGAAAPGGKLQMTPEQAQAFFRRKVETELMPKALYDDPKGFTEKLCDEQEKTLRAQYERVYKNPADCPYPESDLSVMALSIREGLLLIRLDLPPVKGLQPVAVRAYVLYAEEENKADYYTIELTQEKDVHKIGRVLADGRYEDIGEAPPEGAELQRMLDLYDFYHNGGN